MKRKLLLSLALLAFSFTGFCTVWTINSNATSFIPATVTITFGDSVYVNMTAAHDAREVSQTTWNANDTTSLPGFQVPFGGGYILPAELGVGTHYYNCTPHAMLGMRGIIIVQSPSGIIVNQQQPNILAYPNPANGLLTIKANNNTLGSQYFITDQSGKQVLTGKLIDETTLVDISQLAKGVYLFHMAGQRRQSFKVIKN